VAQMQPGESEHGGDSTGVGEALLQCHLAEYNALATRVSYQLTLQIALWPVALLAIGLAAQLWNTVPHHGVLLWTTALFVEVIVAVWYEITIDILNAVYYVEAKLRPEVAPLVGARPFWQYEQWLGMKRNRQPLLGDLAIPVVLAAALIVAGFERRPVWDQWDYWGSLLNGVLVAFLAWRALCSASARRQVLKVSVGQPLAPAGACQEAGLGRNRASQ